MPTRRVLRLVARSARFAAFGVLATGLASPGLALAHEGLRSSSPSAGEVVTASVTELRLNFTTAPEIGFTSVELRRLDGSAVSLGKLVLSGGVTVVVPLSEPLTPGRYNVAWRTAGRDGHPVTGEYAFSIAPNDISPGAGTSDSATSPVVHHDPVAFPTGRAFDAESPAYAALRMLQFVALLSLIGAVAFRQLVLRLVQRRNGSAAFHGAAEERAASIARWSAVALLALAVARLGAQAYAMHGPGESSLGAMRPMILDTTWGTGWILQVAGSALVIAAFVFGPRRTNLRWGLAAVGMVALAFTSALSGHAASVPGIPELAVTADALHVIGAGGWLGSLLVVLAAGMPAAMRLEAEERGTAVIALVNSFSATALVFAAIVASTGLGSAWIHVGSVAALWTTPYGRTLLVKLAVLSVVAATGAYNWLRVRPALGGASGASGLRRSATVELVAGFVVLAVTAVLVATPTPMDSP